jgi:hypothetical protein
MEGRMYNKINAEVLEGLIDAAQWLKDHNGKDAEIYFADFINATKKLKDNIYPRMGIMVIPGLEGSQKSVVRSGIVPLPRVCID